MSDISFLHRLYDLRDKQNLTQSQLAKKINVSLGTIKKWETGTKPSYDSLEQISDFFNVPVDYLMGRVEKISDAFTYGLDEDDIDRLVCIANAFRDRKKREKNES